MKNIFVRIKVFLYRVKWVSCIMGSYVTAIKYLVVARSNPEVMGKAKYNDFSFKFCGRDLSALKEVLIDNEYSFLTSMLKSKDEPIIIDIGAHIGTFSMWCFGINRKTQILSIEADPKTYKTLQNNITYNDSNKVKWWALNRAAWENNDIITFSDEGDSMSHKISNEGKISVQGISLKDIILKFKGFKINLMKVDIEGAEEAFICKDPSLLENIECLVIELHPNLCDTDRVYEVLKKYYSDIKDIKGRASSKPLLICKN